MASLEEMRRWACGEHVQGLPHRKFEAGPNVSRILFAGIDGTAIKGEKATFVVVDDVGAMMEELEGHKTGPFSSHPIPKSPKPISGPSKKFAKPRYKISTSGEDAMLFFGKHRGKMLSHIGEKDPTYLDFIVKSEFPDDLKDVARYIKKELIKKSKSIKIFEGD